MSLDSSISRRIVRLSAGRPSACTDKLTVEEPLEIRLNNQPLSVTMRTPGHDLELAAGFLFAEGIVRNKSDIARMEPHPRNQQGNVLNVILNDGVGVDWSRLKRQFATTSSCGLCGRESIAAVRRRLPRVKSGERISVNVVDSLPAKLRAAQAVFAETGGLHAAGLFDLRGRLLIAREDVGRHNAVDKVVGWGLRNGRLPFRRHILLVSGRASFEIVQKALAAGLAFVGAVSAPSSLAVDLAKSAGITLVGFLRKGSMNAYTRPRRIVK
ncbi:formate dehydrogenase accessory sulfurtransferase FdhD [bacterium]|nr:formate dehydrogenase accessory sulfurtransferase FdhD [bacterium]